MSHTGSSNTQVSNRDHRFATTHWSVIQAADGSGSPEALEALRKLCETYWLPVYAFVRRSGNTPTDSQDLTQEFFQRLLAKQFFAQADRARGRFRNFLLASLRNFIRKEWRDAHRLERGGGITLIPLDRADGENRLALDPVDDATPDLLYERRFALALLDTVLARLRQDYDRSGRAATFEQLQHSLWGPDRAVTHRELGLALGMTEGAVKVAVHRLRGRYRELLREEVGKTVASEAEAEELRHLLEVMSG